MVRGPAAWRMRVAVTGEEDSMGGGVCKAKPCMWCNFGHLRMVVETPPSARGTWRARLRPRLA